VKFLAPFLPHIAGGLLLVVLACVIGWRIEAGRLATRTTERDQALAEVTRLKAAVTGKDATIAAQAKSIEQWQAQATPAKAMADAAVRAAAAAEQVAARTAALNQAEVKDRANPDCAAVLAIDLARVCPAIAAGVRTRAAGGVRRPTGGDPSAGGQENR
jgi:hypothetical protein